MTSQDETRTQGVDFGGLDDAIAALEYPISCSDLVERYGDHEIVHVNGTQRVADILGDIDDTFESADDVRELLVGSIGMDAVGRKRYSGRGGSLPEEEEQYDGETI